MKSKKNTIILIIVFVGLMIGTSALYNSLSEKYKPDALSLNQATTENSVPNLIRLTIYLRFRMPS